MNAPLARPINGHALPDEIDTRSSAEIFAGHCEARALRVLDGTLLLSEAVDELQGYAKLTGLIDRVGQDRLQAIMGAAFAAAEILLDDDAAYEREIMLGTAQLVRGWELADPRDAWRHGGEAPPPADFRNSDISGKPADNPRPYSTPRATIAAFQYVVRLDDIARLRAWLGDHPKDAPYLLSLLEGRDNA
jgi:hypothetical protein